MAFKSAKQRKKVMAERMPSHGGTPDVNAIIAYEDGSLDNEGTVELFQGLVDSGMAWRLQGSYGRQAQALIDAGLVHPPKKKTKENSFDFYGNRLW